MGDIVSRFLHYSSVVLLFGTAWFFFREQRHLDLSEASVLRTSVRKWLLTMVLLAIASGVAWFALAMGRMSQTSLAIIDPDALSAVLRETDFGQLWAIRLCLASILVAVLLAFARLNVLHVALSAVLLASLALTGHARSEEGAIGAVHATADAFHLLAAGLWLGGLCGLLLLVRRTCLDRGNAAIAALRRFGGTGTLAVGVLAFTGVVNTAVLVGSPQALTSTRYGQLLLCKLALFGVMVTLAAINRFTLIRRLCQPDPVQRTAFARLKRNVAIEQIVGLGVLVTVSVLGASAPPV